jgi:hypothetical protein
MWEKASACQQQVVRKSMVNFLKSVRCIEARLADQVEDMKTVLMWEKRLLCGMNDL